LNWAIGSIVRLAFGGKGDVPVDAVRESALFRSLAAQHPSVELWADEGFAEGGWLYFWIVSRFGEGSIRNLAYVRVRDGQLQRRSYDAAGDDLWVSAE
jgi:hypothetical protein